MEYKIGQRVEHAGGIFYIDFVCRDIAQISNENYTHQVRTDGLSPIYKPGDQVRVTATEGDLADIYLDGVVTKGSIIAVEGYIEGGWIKFDGWSINIKYVEWYSGVEDKPGDALIGVKRVDIDYDKINGLYKKGEHVPVHVLEAQTPGLQDQATFGCDCIVTVKNGKTYVEPLTPLASGECMAYITAEGGKTEWSGAPTVWNDQLESKHIAQIPQDKRGLVPEWFRDKEMDRAALAEVLKIKETPQQLWKCPYYDNHTHRPCNETGSKHDIRQHSKTAHGEALPPTNSPVWEHWRVS